MLKILNQVIHLTENADMVNYQYDKVYSMVDDIITINGTQVTMAANSTIEILVKSITSISGIYLMGHKKIKHILLEDSGEIKNLTHNTNTITHNGNKVTWQI